MADLKKDIALRINASGKGLKKLSDDIGGISTRLNFLGKAARTAKAGLVTLTAGVVSSVFAFSKYETALNGVAKTSGMAGKELKDFGAEAQKMAKELGTSTNELLSVAEAAAQLGIRGTKNLLAFSDTIVKLGETSDLQGDVAATQLARILSLVGEDGPEAIRKAGNVLTVLSNNYAATASEITDVSVRVTQAIAAFKPASEDIFGISNALAASGVQAERAGGVMGRVFLGIQEAIQASGAEMRDLQKLTGLTGEQLKKTFQEDASEVFRLLVNGLSKVSREELPALLKAFGASGSEGISTMSALVANVDIFNSSLEDARGEIGAVGGALDQEFAVRTGEIAFKFRQLQTAVVNLAVKVGEKLVPTLKVVIDRANAFADAITQDQIDGLSESVINFTKRIYNLGAAILNVGTNVKKMVLEFRIGFMEIEKRASATIEFLKGLNPIKLIGEGAVESAKQARMATDAAIAQIEAKQQELIRRWQDLNATAITPLPMGGGEAFGGIGGEIGGMTPIGGGAGDTGGGVSNQVLPPQSEIDSGIGVGGGGLDPVITGVAGNKAGTLSGFESTSGNGNAPTIPTTELNPRTAAMVEIQKKATEAIKAIHGEGLMSMLAASDGYFLKTKKLTEDKKNVTVDIMKEESEKAVRIEQDKQNAMSDIMYYAAKANHKVGQAFAVADATMKAYMAYNLAIATYPPPVGQALGAIQLAAGLANVASILGIGFAQGGAVTGGKEGKDSVPAMLMPGELVAPKQNFNETVEAVARSRGWNPPGSSGDSGGEQRIVLELREDAGRMFQRVIRDAEDLGVTR